MQRVDDFAISNEDVTTMAMTMRLPELVFFRTEALEDVLRLK